MQRDTSGRLIAGKYQLLRELGRGAMGSVWQARHLSLRSSVAVKLMDPAIAASPNALQRFLREARAAAGLRSPHVVQILDHGVDRGTPYIVMELLEGEALAERLSRQRKLSPRETARIVTHIARALARAQQAGITHRDLKPENVFLVHNDDEELAKVLDFGIAKVDPAFDGSFNEESTAAGALLGTPYYLSPEQAEGLKSVDHRTDIWSLGVITYECLLGRRPFDGESLPGILLAISSKPLPVPSRVGKVPPGFDAWFAKACARSVRDRFAFAKDAAAELVKLCHEGSAEAERETVPKLPKLAPLPSLPKLLNDDDDDDDDQAPTEIWREGSLDSLIGLEPPAPRLLTPLPVLPPLRPVTPTPTRPAAAKRLESQTDPKASFSQTTAEQGKPRAKRKAQRAVVGVAAVGLAAFAGLLFGERAALQRPAAPVASLASAPQPQPQPQPQPTAPRALRGAEIPPAPELVPTVDLKQLPLAVPARSTSVAGSVTPTRARASSPSELPRQRTPKPAAPQNDDELANPYR